MNEPLLFLAIAAFFIWGITSFFIVIDMFRNKTGMGCLGVILFPIIPFLWVFTRYSGKKVVAGPILVVSALVAFGGIYYQFNKANSALAPLFTVAQEEKGLECTLQGMGSSDGKLIYTVSCFEQTPLPETYKNVAGMVQIYEQELTAPLAQKYLTTVAREVRHTLIMAIYTPSGFAVCSEIDPNGTLQSTWYGSTKELCKQ